ncbi:MAG: YihA family ribosome biogenesis GTP-binding protein [candidate division Zixibacteria bacterium]|nr:YihA family ribosome biogenesis GTP-binding protein [candidate division Zixibacteria bacterium]
MSAEIKTIEFIGSFPDYQKAKIPPYPQVAIAGRSNVGKSSLINKVTGRKAIARVSSTPGKTRMLNFFSVNDRYLIIDLPGYGYAKVSKNERRNWQPMVEGLLTNSDKLKGLVLLADGRRGLQEEEIELMDFCEHYHVEGILIFTKIDKLKQSEKARLKNSFPGSIFFSAVTGQGKGELLGMLFDLWSN